MVSDIDAVCGKPMKSVAPWNMLALAVLLLVCVGCGSSRDSDETAIETADQVLDRMVQVYRSADAYNDRGIVRLKYRLDGQWVHDDGQFAVKFVRPNMLYLRAYQLTLASDGQKIHAIVADQQTADLDGQILTKAAPAQLRLDTLYDDPVVLNAVAGGMGGPPVTLELLMGEKPLSEVFAPGSSREMLDDDVIRGHACYRIQARLPEGPLVFWVDRESFVLRRLEYPSEQLARQMAEGMNCSDVTLMAEFRDAVIDGPLYKKEFEFHVPPDAKLVRRFVIPPQPIASDLIGRLPGEYFFSDLDGRPIPQQELLGQFAVLVWFNNHPASQVTLEQLEQLRGEFANTSQVSFHAICTEPTHVGNSELEALASRWRIGIPIARDLEAFGRDVFHVPWAPTLIILDKQGVVQAYEVGASPQLADNVRAMLQQLIDGKDLAAEVIASCEQEQLAYARQLAEALVTAPGGAGRETQETDGEEVGVVPANTRDDGVTPVSPLNTFPQDARARVRGMR